MLLRTRPPHCLGLVAALLLTSGHAAAAQQLTPADSGVRRLLAPDSAAQARAAAAGAALLHWVATTGSDEQTLFLRNTAEHPIQITGYEIYECFNLAGRVCGQHRSGPRLAPGQTVVLQRIRPRSRMAAWSYRYRFEAMFLPAPGDAAAVGGS